MNMKAVLAQINNQYNEEVYQYELPNKRIKAFIITDLNDSTSMYNARKCGYSIEKSKSEVDYVWYPSCTASTVERDLKKITYIDNAHELPWTWPTTKEQEGNDLVSGLYRYYDEKLVGLHAIINTVNHMRLWQMCIDLNQPIIILEDQAKFVRNFKYDNFKKSSQPVMYNKGHLNPNHNTFKGLADISPPNHKGSQIRKFNNTLHQGRCGLLDFPDANLRARYINYPKSIESSAYVITPWVATKLLDKSRLVGMWPINVFINKQFFPWLQMDVPGYTTG